MKTNLAQTENQERLEVLLAMAIVFGQGTASDESNDYSTSNALSLLSALNDADLTAIREKAGFYENLTDEEKELWKARILKRVQPQNVRLDRDIHYTQIAEVLRCEPDYIRQYILRHLSQKTAVDVANTLNFEINSQAETELNSDLESLLRRKFLSNFVSQDELSEVKPLTLLSGEDVLQLLRWLGQAEIAVVCRGIKDVENLAAFLRQFETSDAEAIVRQMANLQTVQRNRVDRAEDLFREAWHQESDPTLVVQLIGLYKLGAALADSNEQTLRYTAQKLPINLAEKLLTAAVQSAQNYLPETRSEVEATVKSILLEQVQGKRLPVA